MVVIVLSRVPERPFLEDAFREDVFVEFREPLLVDSLFNNSIESPRSLLRLITVELEQDESEDSGWKMSPRSDCLGMFSVASTMK